MRYLTSTNRKGYARMLFHRFSEKEWNFLKSNINRITYSNLSYGNYQLIISKLERDGL